MFMVTRGRLDIQTLEAFLATHKNKLDMENWRKIKWVLKYVEIMSKLKLTLIVGDISVV